MKIKGFRTLFLILIILAAAVYLLKDRSPFGKNNTSFSVTDGKNITRVEFLQGEKELTLEKADDDWMVNRTMIARKSAVAFLIKTLETVEIKSPVSAAIFRNEIIDKAVNPVKVSVFEKRRLVKSFFVFKTSSNIYGNISKLKPNSKPYITYVPGYEGDIGVAFNLNDLYWQPFTVFNYLPSMIQAVDLEYLSQPEASFRIESDGGRLVLADSSGKLSGWDTARIRRYLSYFTMVQFESWELDLSSEKADSIMKGKPLIRLAVTEQGGAKRVLTVWERMKYVNGSGSTDTDRVWGKTDDKPHLFVMRYFDLDPILKRKSYFFGE